MVNQAVIKTAKEYINLLPKNIELKKAYLFGSYAKEKEYADSDIDIALVFAKIDDFFFMQKQLMQLRRTIDLRIEPHPFCEDDFNIQNPFAYEIETTGIKLM